MAPRAPRSTLFVAEASPAYLRRQALQFRAPDKPLRKTASFSVYFLAEPISRVDAIKRGIPATFVDDIASAMGVAKEKLLFVLGLSTATFNRKKSESKPLSKDESERVLGMARLVGQVETMVKESGDASGFNAAHWVAQWLDEPLAALGGRRPGELMDTAEGQGIVSNLLARAQSGAYA